MLEENSFGGRTGGRAAYVTLLLFAAICLLILSPLTAQPFLGSPLAFVLGYIWSRRNRHVRLSLFGLMVITAPYLPWSLVGFGWLLHGSLRAVVGDISGIAVGHLCKYTEEDVVSGGGEELGRKLTNDVVVEQITFWSMYGQES